MRARLHLFKRSNAIWGRFLCCELIFIGSGCVHRRLGQTTNVELKLCTIPKRTLNAWRRKTAEISMPCDKVALISSEQTLDLGFHQYFNQISYTHVCVFLRWDMVALICCISYQHTLDLDIDQSLLFKLYAHMCVCSYKGTGSRRYPLSKPRILPCTLSLLHIATSIWLHHRLVDWRVSAYTSCFCTSPLDALCLLKRTSRQSSTRSSGSLATTLHAMVSLSVPFIFEDLFPLCLWSSDHMPP